MLSVPQLASSLYQIPAVGVTNSLRAGVDLPQKAVVAAAEILEQATDFHATARQQEDKGRIYLWLASSTEESADFAHLAEKASKAAIAQAPVRPFAWANLATAMEFQQAPSSDVIIVLAHSFRIGPHVPVLALRRARILLRHWRDLNPGLRVKTASELRLAWSQDQAAVTRLARDPRYRPIIEYSVSPLPGAKGWLKSLREG